MQDLPLRSIGASDLESPYYLSMNDRINLELLKNSCPLSNNEAKRLRVLKETKLLDTDVNEDVYSRNAQLIARLFKVN